MNGNAIMEHVFAKNQHSRQKLAKQMGNYVDRDNEGNGSRKRYRYRKKSFGWYQRVIASHGKLLD